GAPDAPTRDRAPPPQARPARGGSARALLVLERCRACSWRRRIWRGSAPRGPEGNPRTERVAGCRPKPSIIRLYPTRCIRRRIPVDHIEVQGLALEAVTCATPLLADIGRTEGAVAATSDG